MNELTLKFFERMATQKNVDPNDVKLAKNTDYSSTDATFILKYATHNSEILDLGAGTGLIVNKLYKDVASITAVESFESFSKFIVKSPNVKIVNENIFHYTPDKLFDVITAFGTMHYVNELEAVEIYKRYRNYLKDNGVFIVKNQFGVTEDVNVSGYSEEQKTDYWAQYRFLEKEKELFQQTGYEIVEVCDIYPPECNRWGNTHFYAIVARNTK